MSAVHSRLSQKIANLNASSRTAILACLVAAMSYLAARLGTTVVMRPEVAWPLWPANILVVSVLLHLSRRLWPLLIAAVLATYAIYDLGIGIPIRSIIFFQLADATEILTAALGLSYCFEGVPRLDSVKALAKYSLFAVFLAPFAGAFFGALTTHGEYWRSWRIAFLAQALGYLTLMPAILGWVRTRSEWVHAPLSRYLEAVTLLAGLSILGYFSFVSRSTIVAPVLTVVPFMLWAALRFGTTGVSSLTIVMVFLAIWGVVHGSGPFVGPESVHNVPSIQVLLLFLAAPFIVLAVVVEERTQSQLSLRASDERFRLAEEAGKMFAYDWDVATDVIERSPEAARILGVDEAAQTTGQQILAKVHAEDRERVTAAIAALSAEKPDLRISFRMVRSDSSVIWVDRSSRAQFDGQGRLLRLVGMVVDVTERKRVEEERRESESRFRLMADTAPVLIWMSGPDKQCTYFNKPWLDFTGRAIDAELGNGWAEGIHNEDLQRCWEVYRQAFDRREEFRMEYRLRRYDGEYRWILDIGVPRFGQDRSFAGYIGVGIDVTERKCAEEALASVSRRLIEAQERERGRIARELHDDIGQRLALLSSGLAQLRQGSPNLPGEVGSRLGELRKQISEVAADIQSLSHQLHSAKLQYLGLAAAIKGFCKEFGEQQSVEVDFNAHDVPSPVPTDVSLCLFRVMQESLHNSAKHSGVRHFEVELWGLSGEIHLRVSDSGSGFDVAATKATRGLGLVSMEERLKLINGTFSVTSQPKCGTTIQARVPLSSASDDMRSAR
jgi:PAS domain S-box-containing protein